MPEGKKILNPFATPAEQFTPDEARKIIEDAADLAAKAQVQRFMDDRRHFGEMFTTDSRDEMVAFAKWLLIGQLQ